MKIFDAFGNIQSRRQFTSSFSAIILYTLHKLIQQGLLGFSSSLLLYTYLTGIRPDDGMEGMILELAHVQIAGEVNPLREVGEVGILGDVLFVGGGEELAAVVGVRGPHHANVGEHLH